MSVTTGARRSAIAGSTLGVALGLGAACFSGTFLAGQPCSSDADCGPELRCEEGRCGGATGSASATSTSGATASTTATSASGSESASATSGVAETSSGSTSAGESCGFGRCRDLDLLLVVDNSPSMKDKGEILISVMFSMADTVLPSLDQLCSVHMGIITTDAYAKNPAECQQLGALVRVDQGGELCPFAEGHPYATKADLDNLANLVCVGTPGSSGDPDEQVFDAITATLGSQLNSGCNEGFIRPDAFLAVFLATDEDDGDDDPQGHKGSTSLPPALWHDALSNLKGGEENVYIAALLGDPNPNTSACPWSPLEGEDGVGADSAPTLRAFIESFPEDQRSIGTLCDDAPTPEKYNPLMAEVIAEIMSVCAE